MSAVWDSGLISPISARYAAQLRDLLNTQAMKRMAAMQEAARQAEEARREKAAAPAETTDPVDPASDVARTAADRDAPPAPKTNAPADSPFASPDPKSLPGALVDTRI